MTPQERDALWVCKDCRVQYPVPVLARDCEARHDAQLAELRAV